MIDYELYEAERVKQSAGIERVPDRFNDARVSLYHDIAAAIDDGVDGTSERGRTLITRWRAMVDDECEGVDEAGKAKIRDVGTVRLGARRGFSRRR